MIEKKRNWVVMVLLLCVLTVTAGRPKVGLVLGGGGGDPPPFVSLRARRPDLWS